jgi:hypothetical protein
MDTGTRRNGRSVLENPLGEMRIMQYLGPHPGLCQLHHILQDEEISENRCVYMVMDLMRGECHCMGMQQSSLYPGADGDPAVTAVFVLLVGPELYTYVERDGRLEETAAVGLFRQILEGISNFFTSLLR